MMTKNGGFSEVIELLGIEIDGPKLQLRISQAKLIDMVSMLNEWAGKKMALQGGSWHHSWTSCTLFHSCASQTGLSYDA